MFTNTSTTSNKTAVISAASLESSAASCASD
jgi:hypothetical protein